MFPVEKLIKYRSRSVVNYDYKKVQIIRSDRNESNFYVHFAAPGSGLRKSSEKQFNYQRLKNEAFPQKTKPERPPQPKCHIATKEEVLIDVSPPCDGSSFKWQGNHLESSSKVVSLIDEPIDVPDESK